MANGVYFLCALTSGLCAILLIREYMRHHTRLLLWSSLAFSCFAFLVCWSRFRLEKIRREVDEVHALQSLQATPRSAR